MANQCASPVLPMGQYNAASNISVFQSPVPSTPPEWARVLIEDVRHIKEFMPKIESLQQSINLINVRTTTAETKIKTLETKNAEASESLQFLGKEYEDQKKQLEKYKQQVNKLQNKCENLESIVQEHKLKEIKFQEKIWDLESRSMQNNLIFYGLDEPEPPKNGEAAEPDQCKQLVRGLIADELHIDHTQMVIERVHRLGGATAKKPRPIVAKFHDFKEREQIRFKSYDEESKKRLKEKKYGVEMQTPQAYRDAKKAFTGHIDSQKLDKKNTKIVGNKLFQNNKITTRWFDGKILDYVN
ncbi:hypothetical protein ACF0H5_004941 [Mactra antiquata]